MKRILVVDDEPGIREVVTLLLRMDGHNVVEASNGKDACLLYTPGDFDLIITDYDMPEMNGEEMARTIKCLVPSQRILMLTAYTGEVCCAGNPVDAVIEKPFSIDDLRQMIAALTNPHLTPRAPARPMSVRDLPERV